MSDFTGLTSRADLPELIEVTVVPRDFRRRLLLFDWIAFYMTADLQGAQLEGDDDLDWLIANRYVRVFDFSSFGHLSPPAIEAVRQLMTHRRITTFIGSPIGGLNVRFRARPA